MAVYRAAPPWTVRIRALPDGNRSAAVIHRMRHYPLCWRFAGRLEKVAPAVVEAWRGNVADRYAECVGALGQPEHTAIYQIRRMARLPDEIGRAYGEALRDWLHSCGFDDRWGWLEWFAIHWPWPWQPPLAGAGIARERTITLELKLVEYVGEPRASAKRRAMALAERDIDEYLDTVDSEQRQLGIDPVHRRPTRSPEFSEDVIDWCIEHRCLRRSWKQLGRIHHRSSETIRSAVRKLEGHLLAPGPGIESR